jgi:alpha-mannosidase
VTPNPQGSLPAGQHSFVNVSPHNILLTGLKPAEGEGLAFRLWECAGQDTTAHIDLNGLGAIHQAVLTDLLESPLAPLAFKEGSLSLPVKKHGLAAGRVSFTTQK